MALRLDTHGTGVCHRPVSSSQLPRNHVGLLVIGGVFAVLGGSCETCGAVSVIAPARNNSVSAGLTVMLFAAIVFLLPAAVLLTIGFRTKKRIARLERLDALGQVSTRMRLDTVAADLGVTAAEARDLILDAVGRGILRGRLDLEQGVFYSAEADMSFPQSPFHCRRCGANTQIVLVPGQWPTCPYCHTPG